MSRRKPKPFSEDAWHSRLCNWALWSSIETGVPNGLARRARDIGTPVEADAQRIDGLISTVRIASNVAAMAITAVRIYYERELWKDAAKPYVIIDREMAKDWNRAWTQQQDGLTGAQRAERYLRRGMRMLAEQEDREGLTVKRKVG